MSKGTLVGYAIVNDRSSDRYQLVSIYSDGTESHAYGSYQTYEAAEIAANEYEEEMLPVEDRTSDEA